MILRGIVFVTSIYHEVGDVAEWHKIWCGFRWTEIGSNGEIERGRNDVKACN